ncbi:MAG: insulinase family protein [Spirochaetaceae bacterium]|nr:insulinase family protein [Spirochaetaceae bacterium]
MKKFINRAGHKPALFAKGLVGLFVVLFIFSNYSKNAAYLFAQDNAFDIVSNEKTPFMPNAKTGRLENGLTYYMLENKMPQNRAFIRLVVKAGSVLETEDERGLAHFVEHMAFNGTERFPEQALINYMRSLGMRFGADLNAYTSFDETVYMLETPTELSGGKKTIPRKALEIFDDWTYAILFNEKDVDDERAVILEEKRTRTGVQERLVEAYYPLLYAGSRYAERLPIGLAGVISGAPASRLKDFYTKWYKPENMALVIVGDFDVNVLLEQLPALFTAKKNAAPFTRPLYSLPPPEEKALRVKVWQDGELTSTHIMIHSRMDWLGNNEDMRTYHRRITDNLIDFVMSERFNALALDSASPFTDAGAGISNLTSTSEMYTLSASPKNGREKETITALLAEKERLVRFGVTQSELTRAKKEMLSAFGRAYNERDKRPSSNYIREFTEHFLNNVEAPGIEWEYNAVQHILNDISVDVLNERARQYFSYDDVTAFVCGNTSAAIPAEAEIAALIQNAPLMAVSAPEDAEFDADLLDTLPEPGRIVKERYDKASGAATFELSNGARVILRPTVNKDDDITLFALAKGGTANVPESVIISARLASDIAAGSGIGRWKPAELAKKLSGKTVSVSPLSPSSFMRTISGNSNRASLDTLFELIYLNFTAPRMDNDALNLVKETWITGLKSRDDNPENVFHDELTRLMYSESPYFNPLRTEDISKIDIQAARLFIESALNPADWTFVFTGNIDNNRLRPLIETYIASIPQKTHTPYSMSGYPGIELRRPQETAREIRKGADDKSIVFLSRIVPAQFELKQALAANVLNEYFDIILTEEIREKLGGVYSIYANVALSPIPPRYDPKNPKTPAGELSLEVFFICDPKRADELTGAVNAALQAFADGTVNEDAFGKARLALIQNLEESLQQNMYVARTLANYALIFGLPLRTVYERDKLYPKITFSAARSLLQRLLAADEVKAVLLPAGAR